MQNVHGYVQQYNTIVILTNERNCLLQNFNHPKLLLSNLYHVDGIYKYIYIFWEWGN